MAEGYEQLSTRTVFEGRIFNIIDDEVRLPTGTVVHRCTVTHPGAVVILPQLSDGTLLLVRQYRHSIRGMLLEFPAGTLEKGEAPEACAHREIMEEVGQAAGTLIPLGIQYPAPGFCSEVQHCFFARELSPQSAEGDEDEILHVEEMSVTSVEQAIRDGQMLDAKSISIFFMARLKGLI